PLEAVQLMRLRLALPGRPADHGRVLHLDELLTLQVLHRAERRVGPVRGVELPDSQRRHRASVVSSASSGGSPRQPNRCEGLSCPRRPWRRSRSAAWISSMPTRDAGTTRPRPPGPPPDRHMAWVPEGSFLMGSQDFYPEERPVHRVEVDGFWM